jgi:aminomethyltransferase
MELRTPFYSDHKARGARFMDFGGWQMPLQFQGILAEHRAVREKAGLFDISHMGQVWVTGRDAAVYLHQLVTTDVVSLQTGYGAYALLCREDGGVIDDLFIYRLGQERFLVIVNATRATTDVSWMSGRLRSQPANPQVDLSYQPHAAGLALQGPNAAAILAASFPVAANLPRHGVLADGDLVIARTGYTGEDGFEIFGPGGILMPAYSSLIQGGSASGLTPCGLGARDTLRLEMGYRLYGNDLDEQHTALEAGLGWVVKLDKPDFVGREALLREKAQGSRRRFVAFRLRESGVPRRGNILYSGGQAIGEATSGTFSPSLQVGIGMGYVDAQAYPKKVEKEADLTVGIHGRSVHAEPVSLPFYRK